jgi:hypothetical protein
MKMKILMFVFLLFSYTASSQILISLLLGDKLNNGKMEFGLDGGLNMSSIDGLDQSKNAPGFNLGFYFGIKLCKSNPAWLIHTGVIVKSPMGATDLPVYSLNNANLDTSFADGSVVRKLRYFNVPVMIKYKIKNLYLEGGPQFGLLNRATDEFKTQVKDKDDLTYKLNVRKNFHPIDAGLIMGAGYRLQKGNGMNIGIRYYYGFTDIVKEASAQKQYNRSLYFVVGIPIGVGKESN